MNKLNTMTIIIITGVLEGVQSPPPASIGHTRVSTVRLFAHVSRHTQLSGAAPPDGPGAAGGARPMKRQPGVFVTSDVSHPERRPVDATGHP